MAINRRTVFCKHYHGMQNPCDVGVDFETVKTNVDRLVYPCYNTDVKTCSQALYPTAEELEQEDKEIADLLLRVTNARKKIIGATGGKRNISGQMLCPTCNKRTLFYSVAYNGHVHARCSTPDCLNWLE